MSGASLDLLERAVAFFALFTLSTGVLVYFLMELRHRRKSMRQARRVALAARLTSPWDSQSLHTLWSRCSRTNREVLEEIMIDRCRLAEGDERRVAEQFLMDVGAYERWLRKIRRRRKTQRVDAALKLGYVRDPRGVEALVHASTDRDVEVQLAVALSLGSLKDPNGLPGLIRLANEGSSTIPDLTLAAALAACGKGHPSLFTALLQAPQPRTRVIGAWALSEVADTTSVPALLAAVRDPDPEVRAKVARALARVPGERSRDSLRVLACDPVPFVRVRALDALGKQGSPAAESDVLRRLDDDAPEVRYRAAAALRQIRGMRAEVVTKVLATCSRRGFNTLISEWGRAGFLFNLVAGFSTRDYPRFVESQRATRVLVSAGITHPFLDMVSIFPDIKVRLRLLRILLVTPDAETKAALQALVEHPECDPRVVRAIRRASPAVPVADVGQDPA